MPDDFPRCSFEACVDYREGEVAVVRNFQKSYSLPENECTDLLRAVRAYLWLAQARVALEGKSLPMTSSTFAIDEMWHAFVLCTKEYRKFSDDLFGRYIEHTPNPDWDVVGVPFYEIEESVRFVARYVDPDFLRKWFMEWPEKYSELNMRTKYSRFFLINFTHFL